jgi:hypothetical protein
MVKNFVKNLFQKIENNIGQLTRQFYNFDRMLSKFFRSYKI